MKLLDIEAISEVLEDCVFTKYFLWGVGTVVGVMLLAKLLRSQKPLLVGITKEAISFKDWLSTSLAEGEELWQDVVAEAKHAYRLDVERKLEILQKQQEVLEKIRATL